MTSKLAACAAVTMLMGGVGVNAGSPVDDSLVSQKQKKATAEDMSNWAGAFRDSPEVSRLVEDLGNLGIDSVDDLQNYPEDCSAVLNDARAVKDDAPKPPYAEKEWNSALSSGASALKLFCAEEPIFAYGKAVAAVRQFSEFTDKVVDEYPELEESSQAQGMLKPGSHLTSIFHEGPSAR
ncbi:hypothetical protein ACGFXB_45815 [Streptomyces canus]|uniref:hypothetical protein n=1 Tax=Streptomyces canus TaxID=58343 RepID=UPI00371CED62